MKNDMREGTDPEGGYLVPDEFEHTLIDGLKERAIEVPDPPDVEHFEANFQAYRLRDGTLEFDAEQKTQNDQKALCLELRERRETECFSVINRGQLWYEKLTERQKAELSAWYEAWLNVTKTLTVPTKPSWL